MTLTELVEKTKALAEGSITEDEYITFIKMSPVRNYLTQMEKRDVVATVYTLGSDYETLEFQLVDLYMYEFFYGLLRYMMIEIDDVALVNEENMDLLSPILRDYIYTFAKNDYDIVCNLVSDTIALYNIDQISETMLSLSEETIMEGILSNTKTLNELKNNKDIIDKISKIAEYNNPLTHELMQGAIKETLRERENRGKESSEVAPAPVMPSGIM